MYYPIDMYALKSSEYSGLHILFIIDCLQSLCPEKLTKTITHSDVRHSPAIPGWQDCQTAKGAQDHRFKCGSRLRNTARLNLLVHESGLILFLMGRSYLHCVGELAQDTAWPPAWRCTTQRRTRQHELLLIEPRERSLWYYFEEVDAVGFIRAKTSRQVDVLSQTK